MAQVSLTLTAPQLWAHETCNSRPGKPTTVCMPWSRGNGKSWFQRTEGIHLSVAQHYGKLRSNALKPFRGVRVIGLCPTLKMFRDIHAAHLESELRNEWKCLGGKLNKSTLRVEWPDGSWFQPMPAAAASSKAARGQRCDVVILDECDDIPLDVFQSVVKPWFTEPWSLKKVLAGGTPRMGRFGLLYHLHSLGLSTDPEDERYFTRVATWRDSPELITPDEVADAKRHVDPGTFAREYECDFDSARGLVYPFDEAFHVCEPPSTIHFNRYAVGVDHGWEHPGAMILVGIAGYGDDSIAWVLDEDVASARPNSEWDRIAAEKYQGLRGWADPSRPDRIADLRRAGLQVQAADNSVQAGIARVASLMFRRQEEDAEDWCRLYVHPRCTHLIGELKSYSRKPDPLHPGKFLDDVVKSGDDAADALRYVILNEFAPLRGSRHVVDGA